jgi:hypothetical protein
MPGTLKRIQTIQPKETRYVFQIWQHAIGFERRGCRDGIISILLEVDLYSYYLKKKKKLEQLLTTRSKRKDYVIIVICSDCS